MIQDFKDATIVLVINSTQLQRQLALFKQLAYMQIIPLVILSMYDISQSEQTKINQASLSAILGTKIYPINGTNKTQVQALAETLGVASQSHPKTDTKKMPILNEAEIESTIRWAEEISKSVTTNSSHSKKYDPDKILLHSIFGPILFCSILLASFWIIFSVATPIMDQIDALIVKTQMTISAISSPGIITQIITNGVVPSIGGILIFVPQIMLLFLLIGLLESSGYLARGAALLDRPLSKMGLNGRSFAPLLSGFVCAIPAILSTRTISNKKERLITQLVIPLMSCSARLPVYGLLLTLLAIRQSPLWASVGMIGIYATSIIISALIAKFLDKVIPSTENTGFYIELPKLQKPDWKGILVQSMHQTMQFIKKAGPIIFIVGIALWALSEYPNPAHPYAEFLGKWLNPIWHPMGIDWRIGVALILSFAAREVFVSAVAVIFAVESGASMMSTLQNAALPDGSPLFSPASMIGLILFFMVSMQCMSTLAVIKQETGKWKWPILITIAYTLLGYGLAVAAYQFLK